MDVDGMRIRLGLISLLFVTSLTMWFSGRSIQIGLHKPSKNPGGCCLIFAEISGGLKCKIPNLLISIVNQFPIWYQPQFVEIQKNGWRIHILIHWNIANLGCEAPKSFLLMLRAHPYNDFLGKHIPHYMFDAFTPTPQLDVSKD